MLPVAYLTVCLLVAFLGRNRGLGFLAYFLLSIILTPFITVLMLLLTRPNTGDRHALATVSGPGHATCGRCNHAMRHLRAVDYCTHCGLPL